MKYNMFFLGGLVLAVTGIFAGVSFGAAGDERFYGGNYDGYDLCSKTNTTIQSAILPSGTIFRVH